MGAGAIGCYVGARLQSQGARVTFVGRASLQEAARKNGLQATSVDGNQMAVPSVDCRVETEIECLGDCDAVLVCVKSRDTETTARALGGILRPNTSIISLQNGVSNARLIKDQLESTVPASKFHIVAGIVHFNVVAKSPTDFVQTTDGEVSLGTIQDADRGESTLKALMDVMRAAQLSPRTYRDITPHQYAKLVVNLNNAVVSLSGQPTASVLQDAGYRRLIADVVDEALTVFRRAKVDVASFRGIPLWLMPKIFRLPTLVLQPILSTRLKVAPDARPSMWDDLTRQRPTEVEELNGEIVRLAEKAGTAAPLNRRLVDWVHVVEEKGTLPRAIPSREFRTILLSKSPPTPDEIS